MSKRIISFILSIVMILLVIPPFTARAADFETELKDKGFPDSYIPALLALHKAHPNWNFESLDVGENFSYAVDSERQPHSQQLIQVYSGNDGKGYYCTCSSCYVNGSYVIREGSSWVAASESAVAHYLDPRNFLTEEYIFQFESTEYNSSHTQAGVENILNGTWMHNANITYKDSNGNTKTYKNSSGNTVKYSKAIMEAAKNSNMSAYYLASKIVQEVGGASATAGGASGTYSGYPGIYNYYNIQATGGAADGLRWASISPDSWVTNNGVNLRKGASTSTDVLVVLPKNQIVNYISTTAKQSDGYQWVKVSVTYGGKSYTGYIRADYVDHREGKVDYNRPWSNPYLSIYNGAKWIADNFGAQFTGYLQKFNVNPASANKHTHEYMANVQAAASEASIVYRSYKNANMLDDAITFTIPVYYNMAVGDLEAPRDITLSATTSGIKISWGIVPGAEKYRVLYKTDSGTWTELTDTTSTSYTWTGAKSGTKYSFTVRCVSSDGKKNTSGYDSKGKSITYIAAPKLSSVSNIAAGVKLTWGKVTGAEKYRIFYKTGSGSWTKLADTTSTNYTWSEAKSGTKYSFSVRCISSDSKTFTSSYDTTGKSITYIAAPKISSVESAATGVKITWNKVTGAEKYRVFYKNSSGNWTEIADTASTSYTWTGAKSGTKYTFMVRCVTSDGKSYTSGYYSSGKSVSYIAAPKVKSISVDNNGTTIKWDKVAGAAKYRVFYKNSSGGWTKIADTTSTSYTWTGAKNGTKYTFSVRCISSDSKSFTSGYDSTGKSFTYAAKPKLSSVENAATGVKISWGKAAGAEKYRVFYKTGSGSWTKLTDTTSTSYTWTGAKSGTKYSFTVRCITSDGKTYTSGVDTTGKSITYIAAPKVTSLSIDNGGAIIKWGKVTGAVKYRIFYKTGSGGWKKLTDTASTSYTWSGAKSGTKYAFTVRCISSDGKNFTSGYDSTGKSINYLSTPKLTSVSTDNNGTVIKWNKVSGAEKYRIFYKTGSGGWKKLGETTSTSFTWTGAKSGTKYSFTVRCISADGKTYTSGYSETGTSFKTAAKPVISSLSAVDTGIKISWGKATGAEKYRVFCKTGSGSWKKICDTTSTSFIWTGAKSGTDYAFTVRCISSNGKVFTSSYDTKGKRITYISAPKLSAVSNTTAGVKISWGKVTGAEKYRVFYKTGSGGWKKLGETTSNSFTWAGAVSGTKYTFTVRCISKDGKTYTSSYDDKGKSIAYIAAPVISSVSNTASGIQIKWGNVSGAEKYRVFYKSASGGWTKLTDTTSSSYTWTGGKKGTEYSFTVRCVSKDGKNFTSGYDSTGKSVIL